MTIILLSIIKVKHSIRNIVRHIKLKEDNTKLKIVSQ